MAGHPVHDHHSMAAFFKISRVEVLTRLLQMGRQAIGFFLRHHDHQAFAAIAAGSTVDLGCDLIIQAIHRTIQFFGVHLFQRFPEPVVLHGTGRSQGCDGGKIRFDMVGGVFDPAKLGPKPPPPGCRRLFNGLSTFNSYL